MAQKIKFHTFHILFRFFAYLADKSGGWRVFVTPKILLGSLMVGLGLNSIQINAQAQSRKIPVDSLDRINTSIVTCYEMSEPKPIKEGDVYDVVDTMPEFPGGFNALFAYINDKITHEEAGMCYVQITGRVICQFVVEKDGSITDIKVVRGLDDSMDKDAVRIIKEMPKWIPGKQKGKVVRVYYTLPISYKLQ